MSKQEGNHLYRLLIELSGLPEENIKAELGPFMKQLALDPETLTETEMRELAVLYLESIHEKLRDSDAAASAQREAICDPSFAVIPEA